MELETARNVVEFFEENDVEAHIDLNEANVDWIVTVETDRVTVIINDDTTVGQLEHIVAIMVVD